MSISSSHLASIVAARLAPALPPPFRIHAEETDLVITHPAGWGSVMPLDWLEDEDEDRSVAELVEMVVGNALSSVQDSISEATREPWPQVAPRVMALPGSRCDGSHVYFWYGASEKSAVMTFEPIRLADVETAT